jgi:hypothetical protein
MQAYQWSIFGFVLAEVVFFWAYLIVSILRDRRARIDARIDALERRLSSHIDRGSVSIGVGSFSSVGAGHWSLERRLNERIDRLEERLSRHIDQGVHLPRRASAS